MNRKFLILTFAASVAAATSFSADMPTGFRFFDNHLTIKPYVSLSYTYDSNADTGRHSEGYSIFIVSPGASFEWKGDRWSLVGTLFYSYSAYSGDSNQLNANSMGESLKYSWSSSDAGEKGWSLALSERYTYISQNDSLTSGDGRGIWRDRERLDVSGVVERRFTERWHADLSGQYNWLDYKNDTGKYAPLYGWTEYSAGLEAGFAASKWTDLLVAGGYSSYLQKTKSGGARHYSNDSHVWSLMGGIGTRATEKIQYRLMAGASWLNYGGHSGADSGWTYQLSANWRITRQLQLSALGSSYYQPSERALGTAVKVHTLSGGVSYLTLGDKLNLHGDVSFRHEENAYSDKYLSSGNDYDEDVLSFRIGATYTFNRWVSLFANLLWEEEWCSGHRDYDYNRFRGTVGIRLHY